jgi:hypothetical protein
MRVYGHISYQMGSVRASTRQTHRVRKNTPQDQNTRAFFGPQRAFARICARTSYQARAYGRISYQLRVYGHISYQMGSVRASTRQTHWVRKNTPPDQNTRAFFGPQHALGGPFRYPEP